MESEPQRYVEGISQDLLTTLQDLVDGDAALSAACFSFCTGCGCVVYRRDLHNEFHAHLERPAEPKPAPPATGGEKPSPSGETAWLIETIIGGRPAWWSVKGCWESNANDATKYPTREAAQTTAMRWKAWPAAREWRITEHEFVGPAPQPPPAESNDEKWKRIIREVNIATKANGVALWRATDAELDADPQLHAEAFALACIRAAIAEERRGHRAVLSD